MPRRDYSSAYWQNRFNPLVKAGGKGAHEELDRPGYSAFWRRFRPGAWKLESKRKRKAKKKRKRVKKKKKRKKKERKTKVIAATAKPSWKQLYSFTEVNDILEEATKVVKEDPENWTPVSRNPNHIQARAREAFAEGAYKKGINPSHLKALSPKRYTVSNKWFAQVVNQTFTSKGVTKPMGKNAKALMQTRYNELKTAVEAAERHWLEMSWCL